MPVQKSSRYRAIIVRQLVSIRAPMRCSSECLWNRKAFLDQKQLPKSKTTSLGARAVSVRWIFKHIDPKYYRPNAISLLYLKLDGARPMSKIFSCYHPIVTAAGRKPADIVIFWKIRRRPAAVCYLWLRYTHLNCNRFIILHQSTQK